MTLWNVQVFAHPRHNEFTNSLLAIGRECPGSLEASKLAELVVRHDDPYSTALKSIPELSIDLTVASGRMVHQA